MTPLTALAATVSGALLLAAPAWADTLDFSPYSGPVPGILDLGNAVVVNENPANALWVGVFAPSVTDGFCFLDGAFGGNCNAGGEILFDFAVSNLTFNIDGAELGDSVSITAFNGALSLATFNYTANQTVNDFAAYGPITRLLFVDSSTNAGVAYSTFDFRTTNQPANVPVPAAAPLLVAGLAGFGLLRRRG